MDRRRSRLAATLCALALALAWIVPARAQTAPEPSGEPAVTVPPTSIAGVLSGASGVRVATMCTNCNVANVTMCGQTGDSVQVWQDGLPVVGGLGAIYLLSVMPSQDIASTEIVRGPGTVLSGPEAGVGAVVLRTREPRRQPYVFAAADGGSLSWNSQKLVASGKTGAFGGGVTLTRTKSDGSDVNGDGYFDLGEFSRTTYGLTGTWDPGPRDTVRVDALRYDEAQRGSKGGYAGEWLTEDALPGDQVEPFHRENIDILRHEYGLAWEHRFDDGSRFAIRGRRATRDQDTSDETIVGRPYMTVDETVGNVDARFERTLFNRHQLTVGASYGRLEVDGATVKTSFLFPDGQQVNDRIEQQGVYGQLELSLPHGFDVTLGLRADRFDMTGTRLDMRNPMSEEHTYSSYDHTKSRLLPRARIAWKPLGTLSMSLSAGDAMAPPRPIFERVCCGATVLGNDSVRPQTSRSWLLDAEWVPRTWLRIRPALFRNDAEQYLQKVVWAAFPNYIPSYTLVNYPDVTIEGGELSVETRFWDRLSIGFTGSRVSSRAKQDEVWFTLPVPQGVPPQPPFKLFELEGGRLPYIAREQGSAFVKWDDGARGLHLSAQAQYTGPLLVQRIDMPVMIPIGSSFRETPALWIYNARAETRITGGLSLFVGVDNITDKVQQWLNDPRYEYNWGPLRGRYWYGGLSFEM